MRTIFEQPALHECVAYAVRLSFELHEPAVMHDAVDDRSRHLVVPEDRSPAGELQVRRDHHRLALVGVGEDLEHEPRPVGIERQEAEFVDDEQGRAADLRGLAVEPSFVAGAAKAHRQRRRGEETGLQAPVAGQLAQGARHVGLTRADVCVSQDKFLGIHNFFLSGFTFSGKCAESVLSFRFSHHEGFLEPSALAAELHKAAMVHDPVDRRRGEVRIS